MALALGTFTCPASKTVVKLGTSRSAAGSTSNSRSTVRDTTYNFSGDFTSSATTTFRPGHLQFCQERDDQRHHLFRRQNHRQQCLHLCTGKYTVGGLLTTNGTTTFGTAT